MSRCRRLKNPAEADGARARAARDKALRAFAKAAARRADESGDDYHSDMAWFYAIECRRVVELVGHRATISRLVEQVKEQLRLAEGRELPPIHVPIRRSTR